MSYGTDVERQRRINASMQYAVNLRANVLESLDQDEDIQSRGTARYQWPPQGVLTTTSFEWPRWEDIANAAHSAEPTPRGMKEGDTITF